MRQDNDMIRSLTFEVERHGREAIVGLNRQTHWNGGKVNVAKIQHYGTNPSDPDAAAVIKVTEKMRALFYRWAREFEKEGFKPLSPKTQYIVIPSRPFIADVIEDKNVQERLKKRWEEAIQKALTEP